MHCSPLPLLRFGDCFRGFLLRGRGLSWLAARAPLGLGGGGWGVRVSRVELASQRSLGHAWLRGDEGLLKSRGRAQVLKIREPGTRRNVSPCVGLLAWEFALCVPTLARSIKLGRCTGLWYENTAATAGLDARWSLPLFVVFLGMPRRENRVLYRPGRPRIAHKTYQKKAPVLRRANVCAPSFLQQVPTAFLLDAFQQKKPTKPTDPVVRKDKKKQTSLLGEKAALKYGIAFKKIR